MTETETETERDTERDREQQRQQRHHIPSLAFRHPSSKLSRKGLLYTTEGALNSYCRPSLHRNRPEKTHPIGALRNICKTFENQVKTVAAAQLSKHTRQ